jgi:hypothetical protein
MNICQLGVFFSEKKALNWQIFIQKNEKIAESAFSFAIFMKNAK